MVLIISEKDDITTHVIMDWFSSMNQGCVVLYPDSKIEDVYVCISNRKVDMSFSLNGKQVQFSDITAFWYRRGTLSFKDASNVLTEKFYPVLKQHFHNEWKSIELFINTLLESKRHLGSYSKEVFNNKLSNLLTALQCGLKIPNTQIVSSTEKLNIAIKNKKCISKSINRDIFYNDRNKIEFANFGPMKINKKSSKKMDAHFHPSLVQEYIDKKIELRIFVLDRRLYTMAIFSQNDAKTALDYRNINFDKPNRMVPFLLPPSIEEKIMLFMSKINLNSGSIDMIITNKDEYVFLEINPVGQFGFLSFNCNYHLEKEVATFLSQK